MANYSVVLLKLIAEVALMKVAADKLPVGVCQRCHNEPLFFFQVLVELTLKRRYFRLNSCGRPNVFPVKNRKKKMWFQKSKCRKDVSVKQPDWSLWRHLVPRCGPKNKNKKFGRRDVIWLELQSTLKSGLYNETVAAMPQSHWFQQQPLSRPLPRHHRRMTASFCSLFSSRASPLFARPGSSRRRHFSSSSCWSWQWCPGIYLQTGAWQASWTRSFLRLEAPRLRERGLRIEETKCHHR